jgi:hypothetical protein
VLQSYRQRAHMTRAPEDRHGLETSDRLGRHRWIVEHSLAWLTGYGRLTLRCERSARLFTESLTLTATLIRGDEKLATRDKLLRSG